MYIDHDGQVKKLLVLGTGMPQIDSVCVPPIVLFLGYWHLVDQLLCFVPPFQRNIVIVKVPVHIIIRDSLWILVELKAINLWLSTEVCPRVVLSWQVVPQTGARPKHPIQLGTNISNPLRIREEVHCWETIYLLSWVHPICLVAAHAI